MINVKIYYEIYRVQQLLVTMANHESQMDLNRVPYNDLKKISFRLSFTLTNKPM